MEREDLLIAGEFVKERALALMKHEKRDFATIGVNNIFYYKIEERIFISAESNVFHHIMERFLLIAQQRYPSMFGTGNAMHVIEALQAIEPILTLSQYPE